VQLVTWENLVYQGYHYPWWAHAVGYFMAGSSMICIPAYAAWLWFTTPGTTQEVYTQYTVHSESRDPESMGHLDPDSGDKKKRHMKNHHLIFKF
jgi:hypothetical protein